MTWTCRNCGTTTNATVVQPIRCACGAVDYGGARRGSEFAADTPSVAIPSTRWRAADEFIAAHCGSCGRYPCLAAKNCQHRDALALGEDCPEGLEVQPPWCAVDRIAVVTCHFNPCGYRLPRENYRRFSAGMAAVGARLHTVELAFDDDPFDLADAWLLVRGQRDRHLLWQKERLLNLAIQSLPADVDAICWIDADILFRDPHWLRRAAVALGDAHVAQLFGLCQALDAAGDVAWEHRSSGWAYQHRRQDHNQSLKSHSGFAWVGRADWLRRHGLYDRHITGGGDLFMMPAFTACDMPHRDATGDAWREDYLRWARPVYADVRGRFGYVPGKVTHLYHGTRQNRRYVERWTKLRDFGFDPTRHVRVDETGLLAWTDAALRECPEMARWVAGYFALRKEDE